MAKKRCWLAVMVAAALLTGALSGCGKAEQESGSGGSGSSGNGNSDGSGSASENGGDAGQKKGMYVEKQEALPEELSDWTIVQMYKAEDKLRLLAMKQDGDRTDSICIPVTRRRAKRLSKPACGRAKEIRFRKLRPRSGPFRMRNTAVMSL